MTPPLDGKSHIVVPIPPVSMGQLITGQYLAIRSLPGGVAEVTGVFSANGSLPGATVVEAVRVVADEAVPAGVLAAPATLLARLNVSAAQTEGWRLDVDGTARSPVNEVVLELTEEIAADDIGGLRLETLLAHHVLYVRSPDAVSMLRVELEGLAPFLVRRLAPLPSVGPAILEFTADTRVEIFVPRAKSGVDMVILADVSGSMAIADIAHEAATGASRIGALQAALVNLLDIRSELTGRVSRLALVAFDEGCTPIVPSTEGMVEFEMLNEPGAVRRFQDGIRFLQPKGQYTDIGRALSHAAQLLWRYGRPENERLVVLISDGADWAPAGTEATGELQSATKDPISLFADLSDRLGIRLHAVAISSPELFRRYAMTRPLKVEPWMVPNHALLSRLVEEGEGQLSRTGAQHELVRFFADLGEGRTRALGRLRPSERRLTDAERQALEHAALRRTAAPMPAAASRAAESLGRRWMDVNRFALNTAGRALFTSTLRAHEALKIIGDPVTNQSTYVAFIVTLQQLVYENRDRDFPDTEVRQLIVDRGSILEKVNSLRVAEGHDLEARPERNRVQMPDIGKIVEELIGTPAVRQDDSDRWLLLQQRLLEGVDGYLQRILGVLESRRPPESKDEQIIFVP